MLLDRVRVPFALIGRPPTAPSYVSYPQHCRLEIRRTDGETEAGRGEAAEPEGERRPWNRRLLTPSPAGLVWHPRWWKR